MHDFKLKAQAALNFLYTRGFLAVIALTGVVLAISLTQRECDSRAERIQDEKIAKYDAEVAERLQVFQRYIELANRDHQATVEILDAMTAMTRNINDLAERDKRFDARINEITSNDYTRTRTAKNDQAAIRAGKKPSLSKRPVNEREQAALKADRDLYPN